MAEESYEMEEISKVFDNNETSLLDFVKQSENSDVHF